MSIAIIKKISAKTVVGDVADLVKDFKKKTAIMRVIGIAHRMETGQSTFGEYTAFRGSFEATNLLTGESFNSCKCFLPDVAGDLLSGAIHQAEGAPVEFAFDISVTPDKTVPMGYTYDATPLTEVSESDPLQKLKQSIKAALPAPKKAKGGE